MSALDLGMSLGAMANSLFSSPNQVAQETQTIYRVEGTPNTKILIDPNGNVKVNATSKYLYVNGGSIDTSINYLNNKTKGGLPNPQLKAFDVNKSFFDQIREDAVDQSLHRFSPSSPFVVDKTTGVDQFGLTRTQIQRLKANIIPGSGRIITP
jgi:filamentous hemagglutinin